jgi:hypothetical protein
MASRFFEFIAITVYLFLEWIESMDAIRNMPRWLAAVMLLGGVAIALIGAKMVVMEGSFEASGSDAFYDVVHGVGVLVGIVGIASFAAGAWRYAKRD